MPEASESGQWRILFAAGAVSAALSVLATLLAIGYTRQTELKKAAQQESLHASEAAESARAAANRRARARDQAEELAGFIIQDLRDQLIQIDRSDLVEAAAQKAVAYYDNLPPELITPESQWKRASVLLTLSDARYQQGNDGGAIRAAKRATEIWKDLAAADPAGESAIRYGRALGELGLYQTQSGDYAAARQTYSIMLRHYENPPAAAKNDGWWDHGIAKAHLGLGDMERLQEHYPAARAEYAETIEHISKALAHGSNEISWLQMLMTARNNTGVVFMNEKNWAAAETNLTLALEPCRALIRIEPQNRRWEKELATSVLNLGALLDQEKKFSQAEPYLREALKLRSGLVEWDSKNSRWMRQLAHVWHRLAVFQLDKGDVDDALVSARNTLATYRRVVALLPGDEKILREMEDTARKYRERFETSGRSQDGLKLYEDTQEFTGAQRRERASKG